MILTYWRDTGEKLKGIGKILTVSENAHFFYHSPLPVNVNVKTRLKNVNVKTRLKAVTAQGRNVAEGHSSGTNHSGVHITICMSGTDFRARA